MTNQAIELSKHKSNSKILLYKTENGDVTVDVLLQDETIWLPQKKIAALFDVKVPAISKHLSNIYDSGELQKQATISILETVQKEGKRKVKRQVEYFNLNAIIAVGYRVNSKRATQFRIWATSVLKDYILKGYAINEKRLQQKKMEVNYLKSGIQVIQRTIEKQSNNLDETKELLHLLHDFSQGLDLLDDYDNEHLDTSGISSEEAIKLDYDDYFMLINKMKTDFPTGLFGKEKDDSFKSSIRQIYQSFNDQQLYPTIEEKAATLLYLIVKNHSFIDGNKRIAAACFLYFLKRNNKLYSSDDTPILSNDALASITLLIAESKPAEMNIVKQVIISILNRKNQ